MNFVCDSGSQKTRIHYEVGNSSLPLSLFLSLIKRIIYNVDSLTSKWHVPLVSEGNVIVKKEFVIALVSTLKNRSIIIL